MYSSGRAYLCPRVFTVGAWLTPRPRRKWSGYASISVRAPFAIATGSRAQMLAMPVAMTSFFAAASRRLA